MEDSSESLLSLYKHYYQEWSIIILRRKKKYKRGERQPLNQKIRGCHEHFTTRYVHQKTKLGSSVKSGNKPIPKPRNNENKD